MYYWVTYPNCNEPNVAPYIEVQTQRRHNGLWISIAFRVSNQEAYFYNNGVTIIWEKFSGTFHLRSALKANLDFWKSSVWYLCAGASMVHFLISRIVKS